MEMRGPALARTGASRRRHEAEDPRLRRRAVVLVLLLNLVAILLAWRRNDDSAAAAPISFADGAHLTPQAAASQHLGAIDASHWSLARELHDDEWMKVWTHSSGGSLDLRVRGSVHGTSAEILSVLREVDLLPLWNRYCDGASVRELVSPTELYAAAGVRLPWPVPAQALLVHAQVTRDFEELGILALARSPSKLAPAPEGVEMPLALRARAPLQVERAVGRLRPEGTPTRTRVDVFLRFVLRDMGYPGQAAPAWITNLIVYIVAPVIWQSYLDALRTLHADASAHAARIRADSSGLYARVARWTGQPRLTPSTQASTAASTAAAGAAVEAAAGDIVTEVGKRRRRWWHWCMQWWRR